MRELRDGLRFAVFEDREGIGGQIRREVSVCVAHGDGDRRDFDARSQRAGRTLNLRALREKHSGAPDGGRQNKGIEPADSRSHSYSLLRRAGLDLTIDSSL